MNSDTVRRVSGLIGLALALATLSACGGGGGGSGNTSVRGDAPVELAELPGDPANDSAGLPPRQGDARVTPTRPVSDNPPTVEDVEPVTEVDETVLDIAPGVGPTVTVMAEDGGLHPVTGVGDFPALTLPGPVDSGDATRGQDGSVTPGQDGAATAGGHDPIPDEDSFITHHDGTLIAGDFNPPHAGDPGDDIVFIDEAVESSFAPRTPAPGSPGRDPRVPRTRMPLAFFPEYPWVNSPGEVAVASNPEPAVLGLIGMGAALLLIRRGRSRA